MADSAPAGAKKITDEIERRKSRVVRVCGGRSVCECGHVTYIQRDGACSDCGHPFQRNGD